MLQAIWLDITAVIIYETNVFYLREIILVDHKRNQVTTGSSALSQAGHLGQCNKAQVGSPILRPSVPYHRASPKRNWIIQGYTERSEGTAGS